MQRLRNSLFGNCHFRLRLLQILESRTLLIFTVLERKYFNSSETRNERQVLVKFRVLLCNLSNTDNDSKSKPTRKSSSLHFKKLLMTTIEPSDRNAQLSGVFLLNSQRRMVAFSKHRLFFFCWFLLRGSL